METHIKTNLGRKGKGLTGKGLTAALPTIILPSDPIALVERPDILMASKVA